MEELQNATAKQKIVAILTMMGMGVAFMGIVGGLGNAFEYFLNVPTKQAIPLAIVATPIVVFVLYFAIILS